MHPSVPFRLILRITGAATLSATVTTTPVTAASASPAAIAAAAAASAAYPDVPGLPQVKFDPARPIPAKGSVREIDSLTTAPEGTVMQRRNNFYRRTADGKEVEGTGLYRWASSGHYSNYDEALAGDFKKVPDLLTLNNGQPVKDAATWRNVRRKEVIDLLETHMFGKVPANVPTLTWTATKTTHADGSVTTVAEGKYVNADGTPFVNRNPPAAATPPPAPAPAPAPTAVAANAVDGAAPAAAPGAPGRGGRGGRGGLPPPVNGLRVTYTVPANAAGAVPLIQGGNAQAVLAMGFGTVDFAGAAPNISTGRPDDWGAIRKNAWAVSKSLDYLETDKTVDAHQVAVTGHSIGGKQALMRAVMDDRIGLVFASCSGEGGASLMRRDWGETIDDIGQLSPGNYCENFKQWMGNWQAMPVDAHMLVALMAPRPAFVTGGTDDQWSDPVGVYWSAYFASPVYRLFGKTAIDTQSPPQPNTFVGGDLLFYNHRGGHITTAEESAKYLELAKQYFKVKPLAGK
ncbi:MAG: hypothetical protein ABIZ81_10210 [Opitutaceae bacterium]